MPVAVKRGATRWVTPGLLAIQGKEWCRGAESNRRHYDFQFHLGVSTTTNHVEFMAL